MTSQPAATALPYGAWPSPLSAEDVARAGVRLGAVAAVGDDVWWTEGRPAEGGRQVVTRAARGRAARPVERPHPGARVRRRVLARRARRAGHALVFSEWTDQRLYRLDEGGTPQPLTPEPPTPSGLALRGPGAVARRHRGVVRARDRHRPGTRSPERSSRCRSTGPARSARSSPTATSWRSPGSARTAASWPGSPGTTRGCRGTAPSCASASSTTRARSTAGARSWADPTESVLQPEWADDDTLYVVSDRTGWWNLYRLGAPAAASPLRCARARRSSAPRCGSSARPPTRWLDDGRIAVLHGRGAAVLGVLDPTTGTLTDLDLPLTDWRATISARTGADGATTVLGIAGSPTAAGRGDPGRPQHRHRRGAALRARPGARRGLPAGAGAGRGERPGRARRARLRLPADQPRRGRRRPASCRRTSCSCTAARPPTAAACWTWRRRTSPAAASASSTSTTAVRPATGAPTASGCAGSGASSTSRTASPPCTHLADDGPGRRAPARHPRRQRRRLDDARRADPHRRLRRRHVLLRGGRAARVRRGHPRLRVALPRRPRRAAAATTATSTWSARR